MKTTLDLNDELLQKAKILAAQRKTSLTRLIEEGLQLRLQIQPVAPTRPRRKMPTFDGKSGFRAGINPLSNRSINDAMDLES
jgi:hypothetical protein